MIGGRVILDTPAIESELMALKKRVDDLEEQVRTIKAAYLALARDREHPRRG